MPDGAAAGSWWVCDVDDDGVLVETVVVESGAYADGARIRSSRAAAAAQIGPHAVVTVALAGGDVTSIHPARRFAPTAPPLWFVEVRESAATPPAVNLLAFTGGAPAEGTLLDETGHGNLTDTGHGQVGAVRWLPATGRTDQLYVQPEWRRRHVASALLAAAEGLSVARDWPRLWGDGQRTELGETARNARSWSGRTDDLTELHPPTTPTA